MYKEITYNHIIKEHGAELTAVEKVINYRFYYDPIWDSEHRQYLHPQGKIIRLCKEQRDTMTFDSLKDLVLLKMEFINRNFEMLRGKCIYNKTYRELAQENHISQTSVQQQTRKIARSIFNEKTVDIDKIKEFLSNDSLDEIYIKINTDIEVDENDTLIGKLGLSTRTYNCLSRRLEITDLKELEGMKYSKLLKCRGMGRTTLEEIQSICEKYNVNLVNDAFEDFDKKDIIIKRLEDRLRELQGQNIMLTRQIRKLEIENEIRCKLISELTK